MINRPSIPRNNVGAYPGIFKSQHSRSTGCRSCRQAKSKQSTNNTGNTMAQSPEAKAYMSAKFSRIPPDVGMTNTPVRPSTNPISGTKQTQAAPNPVNKLKANIHTGGTSLQNYDTPMSPTDTPVPQRVNPTNTSKLPHFEAPRITDTNWDMIIKGIARPLIILFSTPYCGACRDFKATTWQEAYWRYNDKLVFFEFECTPVTKQDKEHDALSHPTVVIYHGGEEKGIYLGHSIFQYFEDYLKQLKLI